MKTLEESQPEKFRRQNLFESATERRTGNASLECVLKADRTRRGISVTESTAYKRNRLRVVLLRFELRPVDVETIGSTPEHADTTELV